MNEDPQHHQTRQPAELAALYRHLSDTFDDREAARAWLRTPNRYLGSQTPEEAVRDGRPDRAEAALEALDSGAFL